MVSYEEAHLPEAAHELTPIAWSTLWKEVSSGSTSTPRRSQVIARKA